MNKVHAFLLSVSFLATTSQISAQWQYAQYFDSDSIADSLYYWLDSSQANNIWQVGPPQKVIFDSAASDPNVMITDTVLPYPSANVSSFVVWGGQYPWTFGWIYALQWKQKLDLEDDKDWAVIEYKFAWDSVWYPVFNNPYVYKFYGFDTSNLGVMPNGDTTFTGTDSIWRDIWLCFDLNFFWEEMEFRYTIHTDSNDSQQQGWMIDNMIGHYTFVHTVKEEAPTEYMKVFPTLTQGRVHIQAEKRMDYHIIEHMELYDSSGRLVRKWGKAPVKFFIDIPDLDDGLYYLSVTTNIKTETHRIQLKRN